MAALSYGILFVYSGNLFTTNETVLLILFKKGDVLCKKAKQQPSENGR